MLEPLVGIDTEQRVGPVAPRRLHEGPVIPCVLVVSLPARLHREQLEREGLGREELSRLGLGLVVEGNQPVDLPARFSIRPGKKRTSPRKVTSAKSRWRRERRRACNTGKGREATSRARDRPHAAVLSTFSPASLGEVRPICLRRQLTRAARARGHCLRH